ncbi:MAG: acyl-CoA dehydrogenase [Alphaproteobacteria bacterium]
MNFDDTPEEAKFRAEVRAWIDANAPKHLDEMLSTSTMGRSNIDPEAFRAESKAWQKKKQEAGWACMQWPTEFGGRGATPIERVIWSQEEGHYGILSGIFLIGQGMCGPTMMGFATKEQNEELLPRLASGEDIWCQMFSEPSAGSDLAGLRTRAEKDGDEWVINGQKIWTSGAHYCDWGILLTRTDPTVAKHKGLTMFFVDMKSPGIEVRPIKQVNGNSDFNEVFFTDLRVSDAQRLGDVGQGWIVALTTLMNERLAIGGGMATGFPELLSFVQGLDFDGTPAIKDGAVRERLADWHVLSAGLKHTSSRMISALSKGETPGPEASIGKLVAGSLMQEISLYAAELQEQTGAIIDTETAPFGGRFQAMMLRSPATRIEGGTDEILRNIIAERVLGLPADVRVDKDVAFKDVPKGA